jgi:beta-glucosidase
MKIISTVILSFGISFYSMLNAQQSNKINIDSIINKMSIEEKVGQMTQIDLGVIANGDICKLQNPQSINIAKLENAIVKYHIGSILNVGCGSGTISLENWHVILNSIYEQNKKLSRTKIPIIFGIDAIHGVNYTMGATLFPQQIGQAATWNPDLVKQIHQITAYETRASGIPWNFSPVLDLGRQPLWSRFFETFGEDVHLAKTMAKAAIIGAQGTTNNNPYAVASCMKHFLGYSMPLNGKDRTPAWISDRELREYFLPTFEAAIEQGAKTVMINSGEINGTPVHINYDILTTLLRKELGFKGIAITDWEDIYKLVNVHHVAENKKEAVRLAIMAGIDMSMTPNDFEFNDLLIELIKEGSIPAERINESVKRILNLKVDLGLFSMPVFDKKNYPLFGSEQHSKISYQAAAESLTLLKNENNILPLDAKKEKVLLCGPSANSLNLLNGAWTHTWQGTDTIYQTPNKLTILEAMKSQANVIYAKGSELNQVIDLADCLKKAASVDKIIICLGEKPGTEIPGNIDNLELTEAQIELVNKLSETGKPIILVCTFNRPRIISKIEGKAKAILYAYLPGDEGGKAIVDCLFGKVNPSGKLPFTYPRNVNSFVTYDHKAADDIAEDFSMTAYHPQFDFGYGLTYSKFTYDNIKLSQTTLSTADSMVVSINIKNESKIAGQEVVQLYYHDLVASITPSVKKLLCFKKIELKADEMKTVNFTIRKKDLSFINKQLIRTTEKGDFELIINTQKQILHVND